MSVFRELIYSLWRLGQIEQVSYGLAGSWNVDVKGRAWYRNDESVAVLLHGASTPFTGPWVNGVSSTAAALLFFDYLFFTVA